jgi:hypothetical protein
LTRAYDLDRDKVNIPFHTFPENLHFYIIISYYGLIYSVPVGDKETEFDENLGTIYISQIEPQENIRLSIIHNDTKIVLTKETKADELKGYFENSYKAYEYGKKENRYWRGDRFSLILLKDDKSAYLHLYGEDDYF